MDFLKTLRKQPVIAAFRDVENLSVPDLKGAGVLFVLGGTIFDLPGLVEQAGASGKLVLVDIDLIKGAGKDAAGIRYLARESRVHGIITSAQKEGLASVQRIFVLDSESIAGGLNVVEKSRPDAVEVLPGLIVPKIMARIRARTSIPIIAGGLITTEEEVREILRSGALAISTTTARLFEKPIAL
jgi:glycerol uptake operon antiterminator